MNIHLTFDVEVWCKGWDALDSSFGGSFERYVYGSSRHGQYALPKTLEILNRNRLKVSFLWSRCLPRVLASSTCRSSSS